MKTDSHAVFGKATYMITSTTRRTGGIRYTTDHCNLSYSAVPIGSPTPTAPLA